MKTAQIAVDPYQAFKRNQFAMIADALCEKSLIIGPILMKLCPPVLEVRFFETRCIDGRSFFF